MSTVHVTASCGCFVTSLTPTAIVAMCHRHSARILPFFDRRAEDMDTALAEVYTPNPTTAEPTNPDPQPITEDA